MTSLARREGWEAVLNEDRKPLHPADERTKMNSDLCAMQELLKSQLGRLRVLGFIEGVSFLLILLVTMPLKYYFDQPQPNKVIGMAHGILFLGYCYLVVDVGLERGWSWKVIGLGLLASIIPFGTFWADWKLFRGQQISE